MSGWASVSFAPALLVTHRNFRGVLVACPKGIPEEGSSSRPLSTARLPPRLISCMMPRST
eukprot:5676468-Pyramimonas_sp.AAC.1